MEEKNMYKLAQNIYVHSGGRGRVVIILHTLKQHRKPETELGKGQQANHMLHRSCFFIKEVKKFQKKAVGD